METVNADQFAYWDGDAGHVWVRHQTRLDQLMTPLTQALLDRVGEASGLAILDLGCGCGETSLALAERGAHVVGIDLSSPMLARAVDRVGEAQNPMFIQADGATFEALEPLDLIFSRFGAMFFQSPAEAFTHLRQQLKPGRGQNLGHIDGVTESKRPRRSRVISWATGGQKRRNRPPSNRHPRILSRRLPAP